MAFESRNGNSRHKSETAGVLSLVPVVGAVASQIGAAANIVSSVSSAGAEIIGVGERLVAKHAAPEPSEPVVEPVVSMPPPISVSTNASPGIVPFNTSTSPVFNVLPTPFPAAAPLPAPIIPKSNVTYPERRILRVRRPSASERNRRNSSIYHKDEVNELTERMTFLNLGGNVPSPMRTGGLFGGSRKGRGVYDKA